MSPPVDAMRSLCVSAGLVACLLLAGGCGGGGGASGGGGTASATASTPEDTAVTFDPVVNDPDPGDTHVLTVVTQPAHGTAQVVSNRLVYTPEADFNGTDDFAFLATDSAGHIFAGTTTITVTPVNDPPSAASATLVTDEDTPVTVTPAVTDPDAGDTFTVAIVTQPANGTASVSGTTGLTYTPVADFNGADAFTFAVTDSGGLVKTGTAAVTVNPVNDAPASATLGILAHPGQVTTATPTVSDPDLGDTHTFAIVIPPTKGTATGGTQVTYTAGGGAIGTDSFTYQATDAGGLSLPTPATATVLVTALNQTPTFTGATITTNEDTVGTAAPSVTDADLPDDAHTFTIQTQPTHGTAQVSGGLLVYTPDANYNDTDDGPDSFTFRATDSGGLSVVGTANVTVIPVNDPPTSASATLDTDEDTPVAATPTVIDPDTGDTFTLTLVAPAANGTAGVAGSQLTYTPNANFSGSDSFTFKAQDSGGAFVTGTASVTVHPVNDPPVVADLAVTGLQDTALTNILPVITDPDSASHTLAIASTPANGTAQVNGAFVTYTPGAGFYGVDSFTVTANDGAATSAPATVTVSVTGSFATGDAPVDVAFGDFDGDGDLDVAVANALGDAQNEVVSLFLNDGTGHLTLPRIALAPTGTGGAALGAGALAVADLNGDGRDDLVIVYGENDSFAVALGAANPANITIGAPVDLAGAPAGLGTGAFLQSAAVGKLNGGTVPDLAIASIAADAVVILTGNGDGTFTYAATLSVGANTSPFDVAMGDFNGDTNRDVAVVGLQPNANNLRWVSVFLGDGTGSGFTLAAGDTAALDVQADADLAVGDLDGDGYDDAIRTLRAEGQAAVLPGNASGTLTAHTAYDMVATTGGNPAGVALADVDGDGNLDLVTANAGGNAVAVRPGAGDGTFGAARLAPAFPAPAAIAAGRLNAGVKADTATVHPGTDRLGLTLR